MSLTEIHWLRSSSSWPLKCANENLQKRIITVQYDTSITSDYSSGKQLACCCLLCVNSMVGIPWSRDVNYPCPWELIVKQNKIRESYVNTFIIGELFKMSLWGREKGKPLMVDTHWILKICFLKHFLWKITVLCVCLIQKPYWDIVETVISHSHLLSCCLGKSAHTLATENYSLRATPYFWMCSM